MSEKNRPPTRKRLDEARGKGQVAQTPSIPHVLAAAGVFELLVATSDYWLAQGPLLLGSFIARLGDTDPASRLAVKDLVIPLGGLGVAIIVAALLFAALLALVGNVVQTGFMVAPEGVARLERLDPIQHLKNMFDREQLFMLVMNAVKVLAVVACTAMGVLMSLDSLLRVADGTLLQAVQAVLQMFVLCERLTLLVLIFCVAIDWVIRRQSHMRQMLMSREDVENEHKDQFGDKHVRGKRNEMRRDMLAGELTENTRKANAVVTNPTHFAVALLYDPARYPLPVVVARGADEAAALIRLVARDKGIPIIRSPQLARTLFSVGREWRPVPRLTLKAVAAVYRVVFQIRSGELRPDDVPEIEEEPTPPGPPPAPQP